MELVSREEAIVAIEDMCGERNEDGYLLVYRCDVIDRLRSLPSIRPTGYWIEEYDETAPMFLKRRWRCSVCGDWQTYGKPKFCPECGAKMENESDET